MLYVSILEFIYRPVHVVGWFVEARGCLFGAR